MSTHKKEILSTDELIGQLKSEDLKFSNISKRLQYVYVTFIVIYIISVLANVFFDGTQDRVLSSICFLIAFIILAFVFRNYAREYRFVDYSLPTLKMLKKAANRYRLFYKAKGIPVIVALLFLNAGLTLQMMSRMSVWVPQVVFWSTVLISIIVGLIRWQIKYKPLFDNIRQLISELENL
ncbi:MAG: hypothetical protein JXR65_00435 [Bacteroidales bacterium]|nr:hypothetical protein [Bacteroidales bacterium]